MAPMLGDATESGISRAGHPGQDGAMQITRFGHAAILVETADTRVLIDPGAFSDDAVFALTGLDAIVVTHQHPDHIDQDRAPALLDANPDAVLLSDPETAAVLDFGSWTANEDGLEMLVGELTIRGVGAQHAVILPSIPRIGNVGVLVSAPGEPTLFHPGDSYEHAPEGVDVLALPLSAPWAKASETVDFARRVAPATLFPIHDRTVSDLGYGVYWKQVSGHAGVDDARLLGQLDTTTVEVV
jgi:L-ascorbate metabolism protein UlaG (beta-lactamase superfamily)